VKSSTRNATRTIGAVNLPRRSGIFLLVLPLCLGAVSCAATGDSFFGFPAPRDGQLKEVPIKEPKTATVHVRRAARLYQEERYEEAVAAVEAALAELPDVPQNGDLREKLLSMHRLAKAKALLANYRERINEIEDASIRRQALPGLVVTQTYGTVWQSDDGKRRKVLLGGNVTAKSTFFVRGESGLEITSEKGGMIRAVDSSAFTFSADRCVRLNEGSILLHLPKDAPPFRLEGPLVGVNCSSEKASTILASITTSGGLKIIANERDLTVSLRDEEIKIRPGELVFALPDPQGLSRKMDVELSTILMTADLLTGFEEPVPFSRSLRLAAAMQARRIKGRFRAVVGDVETGDNFQVKIIEKEESEDDAKKDDKPEKKKGSSRFQRGFGGRSRGKP